MLISVLPILCDTNSKVIFTRINIKVTTNNKVIMKGQVDLVLDLFHILDTIKIEAQNEWLSTHHLLGPIWFTTVDASVFYMMFVYFLVSNLLVQLLSNGNCHIDKTLTKIG